MAVIVATSKSVASVPLLRVWKESHTSLQKQHRGIEHSLRLALDRLLSKMLDIRVDSDDRVAIGGIVSLR